MSRMMPGRIRQEGIALYESGQLQVERVENRRLYLQIAGEEFCYSLEDKEMSCSCYFFAQKNYCQHLAAAEYFVKNDSEGKELAAALKEEGALHQETVRRTYFGGLFLENILSSSAPKGITYRLSAEGAIKVFDHQIDWTLKINRLPDQRSYIIRDIGAFLRTVQKKGNFAIGRNYYEPISVEQFDAASQELIHFLMDLVPQKQVFDNDILLHFGRTLRLPLANFEEGLELLQDLYSFSFSNGLTEYADLNLVPYSADLGLFAFDVEVHTRMIEMVVTEGERQELMQGHYFLVGNRLYHLTYSQRLLLQTIKDVVATESGVKKIQVDFEDQDKLALALTKLGELGSVKAPKKFLIRDFTPHFFLSEEEGMLYLETHFQFEGVSVQSESDYESLAFTPNYQHTEIVFSILQQLGFLGRFEASRSLPTGVDWYRFVTNEVASLRALGPVTLSQSLEERMLETQPQISVQQTGSLLDISFDFAGIAQGEVAQALEALWAQADYYTSQSGKVFVFDEESKKISQSLQLLRAKHGKNGQLQIGKFASYQLAESLSTLSSVQLSQDFQELVHDLAHPEAFPLPALNVAADLRDYQLLGIQWLSMLDKYGFGGILADDMGLGKTLQTIAFLESHLEETSRVLILAPSSLIYNWKEEFQRFANHLDVAVVYGNKAEREAIIAEQHQILVTSYASFRQDADTYRSARFDYLILDEAQVMKNAQTKIAQQLRDFEVGTCFALSGTPIENHLAEIWSIFQIVLPGLLPNKSEFGKLTPQEVARLIKPFVLRRKKEDVLLELPDLIEVNVLNELSDDQKVLYLAQLEQMQSSIAGASEAEINRKKIEILSGITRLRQICDTPKLFMESYQGDSGKLDSLRDLLVRLKDGGHRVLIFSQFKTMLAIIEEELADLGISSYKLTGSTPANERQAMTRAFNTGSRDAFLISLKAGGVGLNLTGADTVILVDLWWNPAVEAQAISRAHRMGQTETVEFYRLITRGTIEEKIQELQESKKNLVTTVLDGNESRASMTAQEIREILGIE